MTPVGGSTPVSVIDKVRRLVMMAGSSLRSLPRIFEIFQNDPDPDAHLPSASGARWWLLRIGLYALREPLEQASDWVYIIDHSIQIGTLKLCLILGIRLTDLPSPSRPLRHSDMRLLALIPTHPLTFQQLLPWRFMGDPVTPTTCHTFLFVRHQLLKFRLEG